MSLLEELGAELARVVVRGIVHGLLFGTGEVLRWALSLGRHRIQWWEVGDVNVNLPSLLLGTAFWVGGVVVLLWIL